MGRLAGHKPLSGPADGWDTWMDLMELDWYNAMEAARGEYEEAHDALQAKTLDGKETQPGDE